jgi:hypothetical protein
MLCPVISSTSWESIGMGPGAVLEVNDSELGLH